MGDTLRTLDCTGRTTREINLFLKETAGRGIDAGAALVGTDSRHNLAVGITSPLNLKVQGHVGYYCCGLCDGMAADIDGDAGWGLAENLMSGRVALTGSAGSAAGATLRGGLLSIRGNSGARTGIAMKGGAIVVGGDCGYMTGFMMQKGVIVIEGDAGEGLGDSLYEGVIYLRGKPRSLGADALYAPMLAEDLVKIAGLLARAGSDARPADFKKIVSGKKLYNFSTNEKEIWRLAL